MWKYNNEILKSADVMRRFEKMWSDWMKCKVNYVDQVSFWEHSKNKIIAWLKKEGKKRMDERRERREKLERRLKTEVDNETVDSDNHTIDLIKKELELMDKEDEKGQLIRSRVEWRDQGEKPASYFYKLEKQNQERKHISKLIKSNGERTDKMDEINA